MQYIIVGLGNPGEEYVNTRHNTGRMVVEAFRKKNDFPEWTADKSLKALVSKGSWNKDKVLLVLPDNFMNVSGKSVAPLVKSAKDAERTVVGGKGLVDAGYDLADGGAFFDQIDLDAERGHVEGGLNACDTAADDEGRACCGIDAGCGETGVLHGFPPGWG